MPVNKRYVHLTGLNKFTNYTVQVAAFTRIGYGALSSDVIVSTDEDGMASLIFSSFRVQKVMVDESDLYCFFDISFSVI